MGERPLGPPMEGRTNLSGTGRRARLCARRPLPRRGPRRPNPAVMAGLIILIGLIRIKPKVISQKSPNDASEEYIYKNQRSKEKIKIMGTRDSPRDGVCLRGKQDPTAEMPPGSDSGGSNDSRGLSWVWYL